MSKTFDCYKCGGSGKISAFSHIAGGDCFVCSGSGKLSYRPRAKIEADAHPELLVSETERSTTKQWDYFNGLVADDRKACVILRKAGAPMATQRYVTRTVMSRAIAIAKAAA